MIEMGQQKKHTGYVTDIITDFALDWLKTARTGDKPFFLMYHHKAPHREWQPGPEASRTLSRTRRSPSRDAVRRLRRTGAGPRKSRR